MSASAIAGTLKARPDGLLFQCDLSGKIIQCGIAEAALRDLVDLFHVSGSKDETFRAVPSEMQHIVTAKYQSDRFERDGRLLIRPVDLLRYGYWRRANSAA